MPDATLGEWYFFTTCTHCGKSVILFPDPSRGQTRLEGPGGPAKSNCTSCGKEFGYHLPNDVECGPLVHKH